MTNSTSKNEKNAMQLIRAVELQNFEMVKSLIEKGACVNPVTKRTTPLLAATYKSDSVIAQYLVNNGADVNLGNNTYTPLIAAVRESNIELVQLLIDAGADPNAVVPSKEDTNISGTALRYAVLRNSTLTKLLLENGADHRIEGNMGPPLIYAARASAVSSQNYAAGSTEGKLFLKDAVVSAQLLLQYGANPNTTNADGDTALIVACKWQHVDMATMLAAVTDFSIENNKRLTALKISRGASLKEVCAAIEETGLRNVAAGMCVVAKPLSIEDLSRRMRL